MNYYSDDENNEINKGRKNNDLNFELIKHTPKWKYYYSHQPILDSKYKKHLIVGGTGGLMNYLMGVCQVIKDNFDLSDTILTASSGGCICALFLILEEAKIQNFLDHLEDPFFYRKNFSNLFKGFFGCMFNFNYFHSIGLDYVFNHYFPLEKYNSVEEREDAILNQFRGKLLISATKWKDKSNFIINDWKTLEDFKNAILASMTIPIVSEGRLTKFHEGHHLYDGVYSSPEYPWKLPTYHIGCDRWRDRKWYHYYPTKCILKNDQFKFDGIQDTLENLEEIEEFFGVQAKCRNILLNIK